MLPLCYRDALDFCALPSASWRSLAACILRRSSTSLLPLLWFAKHMFYLLPTRRCGLALTTIARLTINNLLFRIARHRVPLSFVAPPPTTHAAGRRTAGMTVGWDGGTKTGRAPTLVRERACEKQHRWHGSDIAARRTRHRACNNAHGEQWCAQRVTCHDTHATDNAVTEVTGRHAHTCRDSGMT